MLNPHSRQIAAALERAAKALEVAHPESAAEAREYLEHRDLGLALDSLLYAAVREHGLADGVRRDLDDASEKMGFPRGLWRLSADALPMKLKENGHR